MSWIAAKLAADRFLNSVAEAVNLVDCETVHINTQDAAADVGENSDVGVGNQNHLNELTDFQLPSRGHVSDSPSPITQATIRSGLSKAAPKA